jgi:8-oxo-dGTP diphosphatase
VAGPDVVAGLLVAGGTVLLCHRVADRAWFPDVWDLPGGHMEPGESPGQALGRELGEELGIGEVVHGASEFARVEGEEFSMGVWLVTAWSGTPVNRSPEEHDEVAWFRVGDLDGLALAHPSYAGLLARALQVDPGGH